MITYGFFNSIDDDRVYDAIEISDFFDSVFTDGIFPNVGTQLKLTPQGASRYVLIGIGRAWLNNTWIDNDSVTDIDCYRAGYTYIIGLNIDKSLRFNSIKVLAAFPTGDPFPELIKSEMLIQYPLGYVTVRPGEHVTEDDITNMVGTPECPYMSPLSSEMPTPGIEGNVLTSTGTYWLSLTPESSVDEDRLHAEVA